MLIRFPTRHARASTGSAASISIRQSSEISGNACMISGHASLGNKLRCFHTLTAPGRLPTLAAKTVGPPFCSISVEGVGIDMQTTLPTVTYKGKSLITHGNVTAGNVRAMKDDGSWRGLQEGWQRLRWARERWQKRTTGDDTAEAAARGLGMAPGTYRAYERAPDTSKHIPLDHESALRFAQAFKIDWTWLLTGQGSPFKAELSPEQARLVAATSGMNEDDIASITDMLTTIQRRA